MIGLWQGVYALTLWPRYTVPSPIEVWQVFVTGWMSKTFLIGAAVSLKRLFFGFVPAVLLGSVLGAGMSRFRILDEALSGFFSGMKVLPGICWLPPGILWLDLSETCIIFVVFMSTIPLIVLGVAGGFAHIPSTYLKVGRNFGVTGSKLFFDIMLPAAFPALFKCGRQGWTVGWTSLIAAEILFMGLGLGYLLNTGSELNDMAQVLAVMAVILFVGIGIDKGIFGILEARVRSAWGPDVI